MDKQDAIDFIVQEHENGRSPQEIASSLSAQMGAPLEVVARFVNRTLEQRMSLLDKPLSRPPEAKARPTPPPEASQPGSAAREARDSAAQDLPASLPAEITALRQQPAVTSADFTARSPADSADMDPRLEKFIVDLLVKNDKHTDVIMAVCERAIVDWKEAERLVARVNAKHKKKIVSRRNRVLIPFSFAFIAIGLGLAYAGFSELIVLAPLVSALLQGGVQTAVQQPLPPEFSSRSFWALGIGAALIIGGLLGVIQALRADKN